MNTVIDFLTKYDRFTKNITTGNKKRFESIEMVYIVNEAIVALINLINENKTSEVDESIINNLVHFSQVYLETITLPGSLTPKKKALDELQISMNNLANLLKAKEITPKR